MHADRRTDRYDEVNSLFSQFCDLQVLKWIQFVAVVVMSDQ
jgi:hypothetical protein